MVSQCPNCQETLKLSAAQQEKLNQALAALTPGKTLKIGCPKCRKPIELGPEGQAAGGAKEGVLKDVLYSEHGGDEDVAAATMVEEMTKEKPKPVRLPPDAPKPPDITWLSSGVFDEKEVIEDVPHVLILVGDEEIKTQVTMAFGEQGFQPVYVNSAEEAIDKMQFLDFEAVVLHSRFEGSKLEDSSFHAYMQKMTMPKRRYIYYMLIGPEFRTLYDLEALAYSANLVVNDNEANSLNIVLKKGLADYDDLFGSYIDALKHYGIK